MCTFSKKYFQINVKNHIFFNTKDILNNYRINYSKTYTMTNKNIILYIFTMLKVLDRKVLNSSM